MHLLSPLSLLTLLDLMVVSSEQQYIGCFKDDGSNRVMGSKYTDTSLTVDMCWQRCKQGAISFFGVELWYECYCGDKFDTLGLADNCNTTCGGNPSQICGGHSALSVYSVCPRGRYHMECNATCNCQNHVTYDERCWRNGTCPAGCKSGWTGTGCGTDIDECATRDGGCDHRCNNTAGSYHCSCRSGYSLNSDNRKCDDINECAVTNGNCSQECINTNGSYSCNCRPGYRPTDEYKRICEDIDECDNRNHSCEHFCHNTNGSYHCSCRSGYTLNSNMRKCDDIDECATNNGGCEHYCHDEDGDFRCSCGRGYQQSINNELECTGGEWPVDAVTTVAVLGVLSGSLIVVVVLFVIRNRRASNPSTPHKVFFSPSEKEVTLNPEQMYENVKPLKENDLLEPSMYQSLEPTNGGVEEATYQQLHKSS